MASRQGQQLSILRPSGGGLTNHRTGRGNRKCTPYQPECDLHIASSGKRKRLWSASPDEDHLVVGLENQPVLSSTYNSLLAGEQRPSTVPSQSVICLSQREQLSPLQDLVVTRNIDQPSVDAVTQLIINPQIPQESCIPSVVPGSELTVAPQGAQYILRPVGMFGVVFPNRSFPMDASKFLQVDPTRWLLDMNMFVGEGYEEVKEMCIFLLNEFSLPADKALAVYVQAPGTEFQYRGAVYASSPSAVLSLLWPKRGGEGQMQLTGADCPPLTAKIGVSVEDLASLPVVNVGLHSRVEEMALKVGENLFNFMQSFCNVESNKLVVPMDILDRWFKKFQDRAKKDTEYLKRFSM